MDMVEGFFGTFMVSRPKLQYNEGVALIILNLMRGSNQIFFRYANECSMQWGARCSGTECRGCKEHGGRSTLFQ